MFYKVERIPLLSLMLIPDATKTNSAGSNMSKLFQILNVLLVQMSIGIG